mgnify:CR=1 FL=1
MPKTLRKNSRRRSKRSRRSRSRNKLKKNNRNSKSLKGGMLATFEAGKQTVPIPSLPPATPVPSAISVPPAIPDLPSKGVLGQLGSAIGKYPYTSAGVAAGVAGAAGLGYYLSQDSEGVKNAKDYIRIIRTVKEKTERLEEEIEAKKRQLGQELTDLDIEGLIYNSDTIWRSRFYGKVLREVAGQAVDNETIERGQRPDGTNINSIPLYTGVLAANGHINGIKESLYNIFGPERPANIRLAPQPYQRFITRGEGRPPVPVAAATAAPPPPYAPPVPPPMPPPAPPPVWARAGAPPPPPHFLDPSEGPTQADFQADRLSLAVYAVYQARWNAWNEFLRLNPDTPVSRARNGDLKGGVPVPPPPEWNNLATSRTAQAYREGTAVSANASDMHEAEQRADVRDHWVYM